MKMFVLLKVILLCMPVALVLLWWRQDVVEIDMSDAWSTEVEVNDG